MDAARRPADAPHERDFFTGLLASHTCTAWFWDEYGRLLLPGYIQARLGLL